VSKTKENPKPDKQPTRSPRKEDSLHRLKEQLEQCKLDGNTDLAKKIQAIIKRLDKK
jgi:hypothetical protein